MHIKKQYGGRAKKSKVSAFFKFLRLEDKSKKLEMVQGWLFNSLLSFFFYFSLCIKVFRNLYIITGNRFKINLRKFWLICETNCKLIFLNLIPIIIKLLLCVYVKLKVKFNIGLLRRIILMIKYMNNIRVNIIKCVKYF